MQCAPSCRPHATVLGGELGGCWLAIGLALRGGSGGSMPALGERDRESESWRSRAPTRSARSASRSVSSTSAAVGRSLGSSAIMLRSTQHSTQHSVRLNDRGKGWQAPGGRRDIRWILQHAASSPVLHVGHHLGRLLGHMQLPDLPAPWPLACAAHGTVTDRQRT